MFGELPKLFERNFAIGFLLPTAIFLVGSFELLEYSTFSDHLLTFVREDTFLGLSKIILLAWLFGILLLVLNRDIYRFLEGYGKLNPARILIYFERHYYRKIEKELAEANRELVKLNEQLSELNAQDSIDEQGFLIVNNKQDFEDKYHRINKKVVSNQERQEEIQKYLHKNLVRRIELSQKKAERFPDAEGWLLPTAFGNTLRAFEVYPRIMYGLDAIPGWERLLTVIPKEYRTLIDDAKAQTDFWLNLWFLNLVFAFEYIFLLISTQKLNLISLLPLTIFLSFITSYRARLAVVEWGHYIKAAFDVFLPELYEKLGFEQPCDRDAERANLVRFSQAIIYRSKSCVHNRSFPKSKE